MKSTTGLDDTRDWIRECAGSVVETSSEESSDIRGRVRVRRGVSGWMLVVVDAMLAATGLNVLREDAAEENARTRDVKATKHAMRRMKAFIFVKAG